MSLKPRSVSKITKKSLTISIVAMSIFMQLSCGENPFGSLSDKNTDKAVYQSALNDINSENYDSAITKILSTSSEFQTQKEVRFRLSTAYAGKCGLTFFPFISTLNNQGSDSSFLVLMKAFRSVAPDVSSCLSAERIMLSIGNAATRTADQNTFMAVYGFAKMGLYMRNYGDTDGDGAADPTFDSCDSTKISDAAVAEIFTGFGIALENVATLLSQIASSQVGTDVLNLRSLCETALGQPVGSGACDKTDASLIDAQMIKAMRSLMKSSAFGIEACALPGAAAFGCCP